MLCAFQGLTHFLARLRSFALLLSLGFSLLIFLTLGCLCLVCHDDLQNFQKKMDEEISQHQANRKARWGK